MEPLMNELVGRSMARERGRDLEVALRQREAEERQGPRFPRRRPPRHRPGPAPVAAHA